jgi:hypothetical protein
LTYAIAAMRAVVLSGASGADVRTDLGMLALFAAILPVFGYGAFRATERRARRTGALGNY